MPIKKITILGSTGSIGKSALQVIEKFPKRFRVAALAACRSDKELLSQIKKFKPDICALRDPEAAERLRKKTDIPVYDGEEGLLRVAAHPASDFVLSAIVGFAGLAPTLAAIKAGKTIGLANKEALVTAGELVMKEARKRKVKILPVDSEHSAVFQCIEGRGYQFLKSIILTASGGPFIGKKKKELAAVRIEDALCHPNWSMGKKITIDSATLMNKGLEVIEAHHLFGVGAERINVFIHPQSIVHSMAEFVDGSLLAQLSVPDMKAPIAYALSWPERLPDVITPLVLDRMETLTFMEPDTKNFPCLSYAYEALAEGGTMSAVLNAANETAVEAFLAGSIGFTGIPAIIKKTMRLHEKKALSGVSAVIEADRWARETAAGLMKSGKK